MTIDVLGPWLREFSVDDGAREAAIRSAVDQLREKATVAQAVDLVCLAFGLPSAGALGRIEEAVQRSDPGFDAKRSAAHAQIAAAFWVARVLADEKSSDDVSAVTALAVLSATFRGASAQAELLPLAQRRVSRDALSSRHRPDIPFPAQTRAFDELAAPQEGVPVTSADFASLIAAVKKAIATSQNSARGIVVAARAHLTADAEELELLWWSFSGRHDGDGVPWPESGVAGGVLAGLDIEERTKYVLPLPSAAALLARAIGDMPPATILEATVAAREYLTSWTFEDHPLLPVTSALGAAGESAGDVAVLTATFSQTQIANQVLCEALIRRHLG